jgi:hypothetical protein
VISNLQVPTFEDQGGVSVVPEKDGIDTGDLSYSTSAYGMDEHGFSSTLKDFDVLGPALNGSCCVASGTGMPAPSNSVTFRIPDGHDVRGSNLGGEVGAMKKVIRHNVLLISPKF